MIADGAPPGVTQQLDACIEGFRVGELVVEDREERRQLLSEYRGGLRARMARWWAGRGEAGWQSVGSRSWRGMASYGRAQCGMAGYSRDPDEAWHWVVGCGGGGLPGVGGGWQAAVLVAASAESREPVGWQAAADWVLLRLGGGCTRWWACMA